MNLTRCPTDATELRVEFVYDSGHAEAKCDRCGARYQIEGQFKPNHAVPRISLPGKLPLTMNCPYDQTLLVEAERFQYAHMARFKCTTNHCLFQITQGYTD